MDKEELQEVVYRILEKYFTDYGDEELNTKAYLIMNYIVDDSDLIISSLITDGVVDKSIIDTLLQYRQAIQDNVTIDYVFDRVDELKSSINIGPYYEEITY